MGNTQLKTLYALTLVGQSISSHQLCYITSLLNIKKIKIESIKRLSSRFSLQPPGLCSNLTSFEFLFLEGPQNIKGLCSDLCSVCKDYELEFCIQAADTTKSNKKLIAFDLDSTLIQMEVIDELAALAGKKQEVSAITELAMQGRLDFRQSLIERVALLQGIEEKDLVQVASSLALTPGAQTLITNLKNHGYLTATLSGGFTYFARFIQKHLGLDFMFANELEICNGKLTGRLKGKIIDGPAKAQLLKDIADQQGICLQQTIAVGDGANDLPMLESAGLGIAFHAKPLVKEKAKHNICFLGLDSILYFLGFQNRDNVFWQPEN